MVSKGRVGSAALTYALGIVIGLCVIGRFWSVHATVLLWLLGAAIGAVAVALVHICVDAPYMLANRAEAKAHRRREAQRTPGGDRDELEPGDHLQ
jgi:hypothetical protein